MLRRDYLKFLQLSIDDERLAASKEAVDAAALEEAIAAIRRGAMRDARPAMKVIFDGCQFWAASHFHRYHAARRLGACHQEFRCEIEPGSKQTAARYARSNFGFRR